ncbi:Unknown protein [Striga hermonthica]|uniref:Uncharacterized protein n=1 Tax=Striga hermonthica TaxID=68872 RepID=A0A9N7NXT4_STRHE|nr:Unknown protein [Striga hermonthica]
MVGSSSNQRSSSDDFVDEIPHTRCVEHAIIQKGKGKELVTHEHICNHESDNERDDHKSGSDDEGAFRSVNTRSTTAIFVKVVSGLSDVKKQAVLEMGFGHLLDLKITSLPPKMGFYLVENFNHLDRKLSLYGGEKIHVNEDDVYAALGLPRGSIHVMNKQKRVESSILNEWIGLFNVWRTSNITATKNGMVNFRIVHLLEDLSKVIDMNWCSYMISCLVNSKKTWGGNAKTKKYTGPLLFLTLLYVDKVVLSIRTVPRLFPTFRAWSNELLMDREHAELDSGAFGRGFVDVNVSVFDSSCRYDKSCKISSKDDPTRASENCVQITDDAFWNNPDTIAAIDAIIDTVARRDHFRQMQLEDVPSFSLAYCVTNNNVDDAGAGVVRDDVASDNPDDIEVHGRVTDVHSNHGGDVTDVKMRPKRLTKASSIIKSPFKERVINVNKKLDGHEKMVINWVLMNHLSCE